MSHKRLRCRLGIHDWHVLRRTCRVSVDTEVANELDPLKQGESRGNVSSLRPIERKACVCCGTVSDKIAKYRKKRMDRMRLLVEKFGIDAVEPKKRRRPPAPPAPPMPPKKRPIGISNNDNSGDWRR